MKSWNDGNDAPGRRGLAALALAMFWLVPVMALAAPDAGDHGDVAPGREMARQATKMDADSLWITTDHAKLAPLQRDFRSGPEITAACVSCHSEAETQFHKTIHWTWNAGKNAKGVEMGKSQYSLNNYCISANGKADKSCYDCHPAWNIDSEATNCLVCHGRKDVKWGEVFEDMNAFLEAEDAESKQLAAELSSEIRAAVTAVGRPTRKNCGGCHFYGGGGDGVKHGDLDSSMTNPSRSLDVHMSADGQNFECVRCHTTKQHKIAGRIYTMPAFTERKSLIEDDLTAKISCESCHGATPHKAESKANDHTDRVACQTCHIPAFARVNPTKMSWDWSESGKLKDGKPYKTKGPFGKEDYLTIKGRMVWEKDVKPEYFWFNGSIDSLTAMDTIDPSGVVPLSHPVGDRSDPKARIFPFKVHHGNQPYDAIQKTLLVPLLSGDHGYWKTLDWDDALTRGSDALNLKYSGKFDFVKTTYVFPTTHMVAPRENALACAECHVRDKGRMATLAGFYMPGRDGAGPVDTLGWILVLGSLAGVCLHGLGRVLTNGKRKGGAA